jgi:hypothetical protein
MAYSLLSRIENGISPLLETFERYITTVGKEIILGLGASITKVGASLTFNQGHRQGPEPIRLVCPDQSHPLFIPPSRIHENTWNGY